MGLKSGSPLSDCHSQTRTCPKAQNRNTAGNGVVILVQAEGPACLLPEEAKGGEGGRVGHGYLRGFPMNEAVEFFFLTQKGE